MDINEAIGHYLLHLRTRRCSPHTLVSYGYRLPHMAQLLLSLCGVAELEQVTVYHLRTCVQHLLTVPVEHRKSRRPPANGSTLSVSTVSTHIREWKSFFNWCYREELIEKNPVVRLEYPKGEDRVIDAFSTEQLQQMLDLFDLSTVEGFRNYVIVLLLLDTGIRRCEVVTLRVEDVHETYITVFGKGQKERQIGIYPELSTLLWKYIHKFRHPEKPDESMLFLSVGNGHAGKPFGRGGVSALMNRLKRITGIEDVRLSAHTFRHTFACMYLDAGGDLFSLSREMGHSDIRTTERYLKSFRSNNARKHHDAHSPLNRIQLRSQRRNGGTGRGRISKGEL